MNKWKSEGKFTADNFQDIQVQYKSEGDEMKRDFDCYCDVYRELCQLVGEHNMKKIYERYQGITIQFPRKLYSKEYTREYITKNKDKLRPKELALKLNISERRVRQITKELNERKGENTNG